MSIEKIASDANSLFNDFVKIVSKNVKGDHVKVSTKLIVGSIVTIDVSLHGDNGYLPLKVFKGLVDDVEKNFKLMEVVTYASFELGTIESAPGTQVLVLSFIVSRK